MERQCCLYDCNSWFYSSMYKRNHLNKHSFYITFHAKALCESGYGQELVAALIVLETDKFQPSILWRDVMCFFCNAGNRW